jgi:hypothetical protein
LTDYIKTIQMAILKESDRAAGVLGRAYADALVERVLHGYFVKGDTTDKLLGQAGALGSFSARIDLAYSLGLIPELTYRDLHIVREIGNYFAHHVEANSFDESPVVDWCGNFWASKNRPKSFAPDREPGRGRDRYNTTMVLIALELEYTEHSLPRRIAPEPRSDYFTRPE